MEIISYDENGKLHGYREHYYIDGTIAFKGNYKNGKLHGHWIEYMDSKIYDKGYHLYDKKIGYWEWFNRFGFKLIKEYIII
jgi:antitoxin component YwqK of YwqJK toxin-antitoxin module